MKNSDLEKAIEELAAEGLKPKAMMDAVKKRYPKATKKEIIRAAFAKMIDTSSQNLELSRNLQAFAIAERGDE
jgi:hypothetical protein